MRKIVCVLAVILMMAGLTSCGMNEFFATLGFDTHDYEGEKIIAAHSPQSEIGEELADMVKILSINSATIPEFDGTTQAIECCRDAILNRMYSDNFARYAGNPTLIGDAEEIYPELNFSVVIPADDFENIAYKYFGGKEKITNKSGLKYEYVDGINGYITASKPVAWSVDIDVTKVEETENTFRLSFTCSEEGKNTHSYFALIIKRPDDSLYFKFIRKA